MKLWKSSVLIIGIAVLLFSSMTVTAETESDAQGDVWHFVYPYWEKQTIDDQPNVDIKEIKAEVSGDQITLSMTLWPGGTFSRSQYEKTAYIMFYNTSDAYYMMSYTDIIGGSPSGGAFGFSLDPNGSYFPSSAEVTVNGNILNATMNKVGEDTIAEELWGTAWIFEDYSGGEYTHDQWFDWVGDYTWDPDFEPEDGDGDDTEGDGDGTNGNGSEENGDTSNGTPGFEVLVLLAAIGAIFIILRRRK